MSCMPWQEKRIISSIICSSHSSSSNDVWPYFQQHQQTQHQNSYFDSSYNYQSPAGAIMHHTYHQNYQIGDPRPTTIDKHIKEEQLQCKYIIFMFTRDLGVLFKKEIRHDLNKNHV